MQSCKLKMEKFQFLIGTLKTQVQFIILQHMISVSIPHRYSKNEISIPIWAPEGARFQFLIGTLKTRYLLSKKLQSLMFQFLIGTLKTCFILYIANYFQKVSIPHRYSKNNLEGSLPCCKLLVSIPHRYSKNTQNFDTANRKIRGFNSSQVL